MARYQVFRVSGVNIVTHPHSPDGYVRLMRAAFSKRFSVPLRGHQRLMIGALRPIHRDDPLEGLQGHFYRFVQIDKNAPWFNVNRHDEATLEELSMINIPDDLRPNTETFEFVFYPRGHTLYFNHRSGTKINGRRPETSAGQVAKLLTELFELPSLVRDFGEVEITVLPDKKLLDQILQMHRLRRLIIDVRKPNPDELSRAQARVFKRMDRMNVRRIREEIVAERHESLTLDDDLHTAAIVAAKNGKVVGVGNEEDDTAITLSTVDKPWSDVIDYDPEVQTESDALREATRNLPGHDH